MRKWYNTKAAAWGEILLSIAVGGLVTYLEPSVGIPILLFLLSVGIFLLIRAYRGERKEIAKTSNNETSVPEKLSIPEIINHEKYNEQWSHFDKIKEALLGLQSASAEQASELSKTIQRERVYLDDSEIQTRLDKLLLLVDELVYMKVSTSSIAQLITPTISHISNRMHKRYKRG